MKEGEPLHSRPGPLSHKKHGAEAEFQRIAQLLGQLADLLLRQERKLLPQDLLNLHDDQAIQRDQIIVNTSDSKHRNRFLFKYSNSKSPGLAEPWRGMSLPCSQWGKGY